MALSHELRLNEVAVEWPFRVDATLTFIGVIRTPWTTLAECPHRGDADGPICRIEVHPAWAARSMGSRHTNSSKRSIGCTCPVAISCAQSPSRNGTTKATFTIRSPLRPNPIGVSIVTLVARDANALQVRGLDCVDGTPLIDLKPDRGQFRRAPPIAG